MNEGENIVSDPNNVCQIFNEYFANVAMTIGFCENISFKNDIQNVLNKYRDHTSIRKIKENITHDTIFCFKHVNEETVYKSLKELELKKASGYDEISPKIVKYSIDYPVPFLTCVINRCIDDCIFPNDLKLAEISLIYKKNDKLDKENYRPVSVLIVLSKIFEKIYSKQMYIYFTKIFNPLLSAYRAKYGCHDVLLKFTEQWKYAIDNRLVCGALLMDLSKAFDCLPHGLLICKLNAYGFTESACKLIMSYL